MALGDTAMWLRRLCILLPHVKRTVVKLLSLSTLCPYCQALEVLCAVVTFASLVIDQAKYQSWVPTFILSMWLEQTSLSRNRAGPDLI